MSRYTRHNTTPSRARKPDIVEIWGWDGVRKITATEDKALITIRITECAYVNDLYGFANVPPQRRARYLPLIKALKLEGFTILGDDIPDPVHNTTRTHCVVFATGFLGCITAHTHQAMRLLGINETSKLITEIKKLAAYSLLDLHRSNVVLRKGVG
jgi:hypothetical protein